ncbi:hypothetical protein BN77_p30134 [Rhizobium mesoamericanum STM3625]|uniref:Uncharacterized protein n=1 Tax=Rhizobium mesoamericanum STM3625 TaxID=1211777 RepID=K0PSL5_9HYPH|nr:hypothetical protein BN77_p30134 [Rhizobium mesoamericanum STM3625]
MARIFRAYKTKTQLLEKERAWNINSNSLISACTTNKHNEALTNEQHQTKCKTTCPEHSHATGKVD